MVRVASPGGIKGVKVATRPAESSETVPDTLAPLGPAKVNVAVLIVKGFIALLNVAVITGVLGQTTAEPVGGVTEVTAGGVKGEVAPPVLVSESPQPTIKTTNRNAGIQILLTFNLRISFSSLPCCKAFHSAHTRPDRLDTSNFTGCSIRTQFIGTVIHIPTLAFCRLCSIEQNRRRGTKLVHCSLLHSSGGKLLGKVGAAVERPCGDGAST